MDLKGQAPPRQRMEELEQLAQRLASPFKGLTLREYLVEGQLLSNAFNGASAVDLLLQQRQAASRQEAVELGRALQQHGLIAHCLQQRWFEDDENLVFLFNARILQQRLKVSTLSSVRVKGPPLFLACPVCFKSFRLLSERVAHLMSTCVP